VERYEPVRQSTPRPMATRTAAGVTYGGSTVERGNMPATTLGKPYLSYTTQPFCAARRSLQTTGRLCLPDC